MGRQLPGDWDEIPPHETLSREPVPDGMYVTELERVIEGTSQEKHKLMYNIGVRIVEGEHANRMVFDNFTVGSDEDPDAQEIATWKTTFGGQLMSQMLNSSGAPKTRDIDDRIDAAHLWNGKVAGPKVLAVEAHALLVWIIFRAEFIDRGLRAFDRLRK